MEFEFTLSISCDFYITKKEYTNDTFKILISQMPKHQIFANRD